MLAATLLLAAAVAPDLDFLANQVDGRDLRRMLPAYLRRLAAERIASRPANATPAQRRTLLRASFLEGLGGAFPDRTPLNPRTTGARTGNGYRIEKVIFESQPGFPVTANLYLPTTGAAPYPAILFPLGHEPFAKAYPTWQQLLVTFARRGYVALAWDPVGQGERIQLYDPDLRASKVRASTTEHTIQGIQCLLTGDSFARYTVWDGIRALDYLLSRQEVDPSRIGVTGNSGGGTHSSYLAALDDRIHVAAPSCYITNWTRLLDTIGPQDAEQCIPGFLAAGLDHPDFVLSFAPKPFLILSAIRDFFSISGARSTYEIARPSFPAGRISMVDADDGHGYSQPRRLAAYRWFARWLKNTEENLPEEEVQPASEQDLWCTPTGQLTGGESVFSLNRKRAASFRLPDRPDSAAVRRLIGWPAAVPAQAPPLHPYGAGRHGAFEVQKLVYESEPGIRVPSVIVWKPDTSSALRPAVLLVNGRGKAAAWPEIELLAARGAVVMAIDPRGLGETRPALDTKGSDWPVWFGDYDSAMTAILLSRSLPGMRAYDIRRGFDLLAGRPGVDPARIYGAARADGAIPMLHAAALGTPFASLLLDNMLASYRSVVEHPLHRGIFENVVFGALRHYDLAGLAALYGRPVHLVDAAGPLGAPLTAEAARREFPGAASYTRRPLEAAAAAAYTRILD